MKFKTSSPITTTPLRWALTLYVLAWSAMPMPLLAQRFVQHRCVTSTSTTTVSSFANTNTFILDPALTDAIYVVVTGGIYYLLDIAQALSPTISPNATNGLPLSAPGTIVLHDGRNIANFMFAASTAASSTVCAEFAKP